MRPAKRSDDLSVARAFVRRKEQEMLTAHHHHAALPPLHTPAACVPVCVCALVQHSPAVSLPSCCCSSRRVVCASVCLPSDCAAAAHVEAILWPDRRVRQAVVGRTVRGGMDQS